MLVTVIKILKRILKKILVRIFNNRLKNIFNNIIRNQILDKKIQIQIKDSLQKYIFIFNLINLINLINLDFIDLGAFINFSIFIKSNISSFIFIFDIKIINKILSSILYSFIKILQQLLLSEKF